MHIWYNRYWYDNILIKEITSVYILLHLIRNVTNKILLHFMFLSLNQGNRIQCSKLQYDILGIFMQIFFSIIHLSFVIVFCLRVKKIYTKKYISEKEVFNFFFFCFTQYLSDVSLTFYRIFFCVIKIIKIINLTLKITFIINHIYIFNIFNWILRS